MADETTTLHHVHAGSLNAHPETAEHVVERMLAICEAASGDESVKGLRRALLQAVADCCGLRAPLMLELGAGRALVLEAAHPHTGERVAVDLAGLTFAATGDVAVSDPVDGSRLALVRVSADGDPLVVVGGAFSGVAPDPEAVRALSLVGRGGALAMHVLADRLRGAHAQKTAERLIAAGINLASRASLQDVLSRLVDDAREILGARYAALGVLNQDRTGLESFLSSGLDAAQVAAIGSAPRGRGLLGLLIRDPRPVRLRDMSADPRSCGFPANHPPMKSFLGVPVTHRDDVFGNLYLTEKQVGDEFTEEDERIALTLAAQAGVAIANARRYENEKRRLHEMTSVQEVARAILATLDLDELLPLIVRRARHLTAADTVGLALGGAEGLRFRFAHGVDALALETIVTPSDAPDLPDRLAAALGVDEVEIEPLEVGGDPVGVLAAVSRSPMDRTARRLLSLFASQAAIAIANAEAYAAERARLRESARIQAAEARATAAAEGLRKTIEAQEAERTRVARELHDEAGQSLTALALKLRVLEDHLDEAGRDRLADLRQMVNGISSSLRTLATDLRPSGLREHGLASAVERQAAKLREATGMTVDVAVEGLPDDLPGETQIALFRVVQEALTNVARHSGASQVSVVVSRHNHRIRVVVEDDGRGFDPGTPSGRLGLRGIRERVELLGGDLRIESAVGAGTAVIVDLEESA